MRMNLVKAGVLTGIFWTFAGIHIALASYSPTGMLHKLAAWVNDSSEYSVEFVPWNQVSIFVLKESVGL